MALTLTEYYVKKSKRIHAESRHIAYGNLGTLNRDTIKKLKNKLTGRTLSDCGKNETIKTSNNDPAGDIIIYTRYKIDVLASDLCQESAGS